MAEIGLLSSVAGLVSLGITVSKGILDYYDAYRNSHHDIDGMCKSIEALGKTLLTIGRLATGENIDEAVLEIVATSISSCQGGIEDLQKKLGKVKMVAPDGTWKTVLANTKREICNDLRDNLGLAIDALQIDIGTIALQRLESLDLTSVEIKKNVEELESKLSKITIGVDSLVATQERELVRKIHTWLSPLSVVFENKQRETFATKTRQDSGARALLETEKFIAWRNGIGTMLWCTGMPGTGKTVNVSYIIDLLLHKRKIDNTGVAFIYFSYKDAEIQTPVNLMASLLQQLISQSPEYIPDLKRLYSKHSRDNTRPEVNEISEFLHIVIWSFPKVFIIIDALDECSDADDVRLILLSELKKFKSHLCLLIMSRPLPNLEEGLEEAIRIHAEASESDIRTYLEQRLASVTTMQKHFADEPSLKNIIILRISQKIKGMFLMARLYLDTLTTKITRRKIKSALDDLPEGLNSVYDELMRRIRLQNPRDHAELAIKVLGWIVYAARPLTVQEVQHALAVEEEDRNLDEDGIPDRDLLVSVCAGMVIINPGSDTITLVHYTTQDFDLDINDNPGGESVSRMLDKHALLSYAAQHWGSHARQANDKSTNQLAIRLLENGKRVQLAVLAKDYVDNYLKGTYFKPRNEVGALSLASSFGLTEVVMELLQLGSEIDSVDSNGQRALYRAAEGAYADTVRILLEEGASINAKDISGWTALHRACANDHAEIVRLLLQKGANVNAVDGYNATPLYRAAESGSEKVTRLLLGQGADLAIQNGYLQTALHRAADRGYASIVELLLKYGADVTVKDHYGYTPFIEPLIKVMKL